MLIFFISLISCEMMDNREEPNCIPNTSITFSPNELTIQNFRNNALRKVINFSTPDSSSCYAIFWKDDKKQIITKSTAKGKAHSIILINLEEQSKYSFVIVQENINNEMSVSETLNFNTESIPVLYNPYTFFSHTQIHYDGFNEYILTHQRDLQNNLLVILNKKGKIVWYEKFTKSPKVFNWTDSGTIVCMLSDYTSLLIESDEILEINLYGDTLAHILKGTDTFDKGIHHDIMLNHAGNIVAITYDYRIVDFTPLGYNLTDTIICDGIVELDREGNKIWEWSVFDVANPIEDPVSYKRRNDWLHANSICEAPDNNLVVSFRHNNQVWKIDRNSGEILWKLGENGDFELTSQELFNGQHHVHFSRNGNLMVHDNNNENSRSRILYFEINETLKTARLTKEIPLSPHLYSYIMGSAYETSDHNLLISSTSCGVIALVDYGGSIIWEISCNTYPYKAILLNNLNNNYEYCQQ